MQRLGYEIIGIVVATAMCMGLGLGLMRAEQANGKLHLQLDQCAGANKALTQQIKAAAVAGGQGYEKTEADHQAACRDAYDAGARSVSDAAAIGAGRYMPGGRAGQAGR